MTSTPESRSPGPRSPRPQSLAARTPHVQYATAFEVALELRASTKGLLAKLSKRLPHTAELSEPTTGGARCYAITGPDAEGVYKLFADGRKIAQGTRTQRLLDLFASNAVIHVADFAPGFVFIHAGVVCWKGKAMLFPGTSFAGKTTLVANLVRAGAVYYSDEYALIDDAGLVHPFARDLQMRRPGGIRQRNLAVEQLHGVAGHAPVPVERVYFTEYKRGATWQPLPVAAGLVVLKTLQHTIPIRRSPARVLKTLSVAFARASGWTSPRGDAAATAAMILAQP